MSSTRHSRGSRGRSAPESLESRLNSRWGVGASEVPGDPEQPLGDPESVARTICLRQLEHSARTRSELADALRRKEIPEDAATRVLDRLTEVGLIDDTALAQTLAGAVRRERGLASRAVAAKLRSRGLDADTVEAAIAAIDGDGDGDSERRRAQELVARRARAMQSLAPQVRTRRLVGLLARKGYSSGMAYDVVREVLAELDSTAGDELDS